MKALITGAKGFVGGYLSRLLLEKGFEVFGADRSGGDAPSGVKMFDADITDKDSVLEIIGKSKPDYIFHLAAISSVKSCMEKPELAKAVNVGGTQNIIQSCIKEGINPKILITSSAHVYGIPERTPIDENHPVKPVNEYGKSKLEQEEAAMEFFKKNGMNVIVSRSFNHIGPNQGTGFVCSDFAKQIAEIEKGKIKPEMHVGDLEPKRDFSDVRDIVRAYLMLLQKGKSGDIYNIGSGKAYSIKQILNILISNSSAEIHVVEDKEKFRKSEIPILEADNRKFTELTAWVPEFSLEKSLGDVLEYWRSTVK